MKFFVYFQFALFSSLCSDALFTLPFSTKVPPHSIVADLMKFLPEGVLPKLEAEIESARQELASASGKKVLLPRT